MSLINILIVDDHQMVREGIKSIFKDEENLQIVGEAANGKEALEVLPKSKPDIILADISMPLLNGIELMKEIQKTHPGQKVIALTMLNEAQHVTQMIKAGARGYLLKNCGSRELKKAIKIIHEGGTYYSPEVEAILRQSWSGKKSQRLSVDIPMTKRELEVLHLICKEFTNQEIAGKLFISQRTVDAHKRNLLEKTGTKNIAGLVLYAIEKQLFDEIG